MFRRNFRQKRRGTVAVLVAMSLVVILSVVAIAVDGGTLFVQRRQVQATADAAALAGAADLYDHYFANSGQDPDGTAKASALAIASANGFVDGVNATVTVNIPPQSGLYANKPGYIEVIIEYHQPRSFSNIFGKGDLPVRARAVALGSAIAADVGILALNPTIKGAFNAQGGGTSTVTTTPIVVNSTSDEAAIAGGGGTVVADEYFIGGGYTTTGGGILDGTIHTQRPGLEDPLIDMPPPDPTTMTVQSTKKVQYTSGTTTLSPGVYTGGISVSGTGSLTLEPGIYYMDGGGFQFSGQGSLFGEGVMIYNAPSNGNADGVSVTGQGSVTLSGPTSGIYQGLTFFQDRDSTVTANISGTSGQTSITGTFYFASALLNVTGNGGVVNLGSQYISDTVALGGNGGININWSPDKVARGRHIHLVE
jgi:hypothetical protein